MNYQELIDQIEQSTDLAHAEQLYRDNINANGFNEYQQERILAALQETLRRLMNDD